MGIKSLSCFKNKKFRPPHHTAPAEPKPVNSFCSSRECTVFSLFSSLYHLFGCIGNRTGRACEKLCSSSCWWTFSCCGSKLCSDIWHGRCLVCGCTVFHGDTQYLADPQTHLAVGERADGQVIWAEMCVSTNFLNLLFFLQRQGSTPTDVSQWWV